MFRFVFLIVSCFSFLFSNAAFSAVTTYSYVGNPFSNLVYSGPPNPPTNPYSTLDRVTGSFTVDHALADGNYNFFDYAAPGFATVKYAFSDGLINYVGKAGDYNTGVTPYNFRVTVSGGNITSWYISFFNYKPDTGRYFFMDTSGGNSNIVDDGVTCPSWDCGWSLGALNENKQGVWTVSTVSAVPAPPAYMMIVSGLLLISVARKRLIG